MAAFIRKRLELLGDKVMGGVSVCQGLIIKIQEGQPLTPNDKMEIDKLKISMTRLMNEIQCYTYQRQGPSTEDVDELLEELTTMHMKADDILVELGADERSGMRNRYHNSEACSEPVTSPQINTTSRLPKLELPKFDGNILNFHEFWGKFTASIEGRNDLSDVDKLTYLQDCLQGSAKELIAGLATTNEAYKIAVDTLKEEYGEGGILIDAHYMALFSIPTATSEVTENKRVLNDIDRNLRILNAMGEDTGHNNALRGIIVSKFSDDVQSNLRMKITPTRENVETIMRTLKPIIKALDKRNGSKLSTATSGFTTEALFTQNAPPKPEGSRKRKSLGNYDGNDTKRSKTNQPNAKPFNRFGSQKHQNQRNSSFKRPPLSCIFCKGKHIHENCRTVATLQERKTKLKGRCYLCLKEHHNSLNCTEQVPACTHCGKERLHNRCLCPTLFSKKEKTETVTMFSIATYNTILQTAVASVRPESGSSSTPAKLLFDCGSQRSYIHSSLAHKLNLKPLEETCLTVYTFGSTTPKTMPANLVTMVIQMKTSQVEIMAYVVPTTTGRLPSHHECKLKLRKKFLSLDWAGDTEYDACADIIIGNDYYYKFVFPNRKEIADNLYIVETGLGWIPSGTVKDQSSPNHQLSVLTYVEGACVCKGEDFFFRPDPAIKDDNIKTLWELEAIGITDSPKVVQDEEVIDFFNKTTRFEGGRYYVKWPWTEYPPILPKNYGLALGRLQSLYKRLDSEQLHRYNEVLVDQIKKGVVEEVKDTNPPPSHPVHYLPHHCIIQEHRSTKMRVVYDASAKIKGQCSLNELLYKGPLMLEDLTTLLLKFRSHMIGLVADIEKAFLQVGLQSDDRDVTRFLWMKDVNLPPCDDNLIHLRFCRVPFGIISSPYLLAATLRYHLMGKGMTSMHSLASCLYVDNLVTGTDTSAEAYTLYQTAKGCLDELSMNLRGWNSNDKNLLSHLPESFIDATNVILVLGLKWNTLADDLSLAFATSKLDKPADTKREVLRIIASVFDPCGFVAPLTLPTRIFLQNLWKKGLKWDTPLSQEQKDDWNTCVLYLHEIPKFIIPRKYSSRALVDKHIELHCFADASKESYVAVVYIRIECLDQYEVSYVISRSRVTPLQKRDSLTIPKLELLAVVIGTRLLTYVQRALDLLSADTYLWTDNQAVLGWLQTERLLPPWVSRRVGEAHKAHNVRFRYVPSSLNPADVATRPLQQRNIPRCWIAGPEFLQLMASHWPSQHLLDESDTKADTDGRSTPIPQAETTGSLALPVTVTLTGDWELPSQGCALPLKAILELQSIYFKDEVKKKPTNLSRALGIFVDENGILRCKGRYQNAILPYDQRNPILLPSDSGITKWVIQRVHSENYHVGVSHTLSLVRHQYWIPQGRNAVAKVLRRCPECVRYGGGPYRLPDMPDLPSERINYSVPFTYTGLDYLGPLLTTQQGVKHKRWVCLFTCMAVRAVHLEVIDDMTTDEFLLCLRRFIAARGAPKLLLSDNAMQFKLAASLLAKPIIHQNDIEWKFITELSPWQGGLYERLVGLVKHCLHRTVDKALLNDSQLRTVMKEIEGILNTRPLTAVGPDNEMVLTPAHFLRTCGPPDLQPPDQENQFRTNIQQKVIDGWKRTTALLTEFQKMFLNQYLLSLRERHTPAHKQPRVLCYKEPCVGDVVQIRGDSNNRALWRVGKIAGLCQSPDGKVRSASVLIDNGVLLHRSVGQLYPLELDVTRPEVQPTPEPTHTAPPPMRPVSSADANPLSQPLQGPSPTLSSSPDGAPPMSAQVRPQRAAARSARQRIRQWTKTLFTLATNAHSH